MGGLRDLGALLRGLEPRLRPGRHVFVVVPDRPDPGLDPLLVFREDEGTTLVLTQQDADDAGLAYDLVTAWITLQVHSALDAVGLTAAVSTALTQAGISCNVVAAAHHDHLFVPHDRADEAVAVLRTLSDAAA